MPQASGHLVVANVVRPAARIVGSYQLGKFVEQFRIGETVEEQTFNLVGEDSGTLVTG